MGTIPNKKRHVPARSPREVLFDDVDSVLQVARRGVALAVLAGLRGDGQDAALKCRQCLTLLDGAREALASLHDADVDALKGRL